MILPDSVLCFRGLKIHDPLRMASKAIFIQRDGCYVGLLLWRSPLRWTAVVLPQGGALSLSLSLSFLLEVSCSAEPEGVRWGSFYAEIKINQ